MNSYVLNILKDRDLYNLIDWINKNVRQTVYPFNLSNDEEESAIRILEVARLELENRINKRRQEI